MRVRGDYLFMVSLMIVLNDKNEDDEWMTKVLKMSDKEDDYAIIVLMVLLLLLLLFWFCDSVMILIMLTRG